MYNVYIKICYNYQLMKNDLNFILYIEIDAIFITISSNN